MKRNFRARWKTSVPEEKEESSYSHNLFRPRNGNISTKLKLVVKHVVVRSKNREYHYATQKCHWFGKHLRQLWISK